LSGQSNGENSSPKKEISYDPSHHLSLDEVKSLDEKYVLNTYARMPVAFIYGSGEFLYDTHGKEYIDFLSGIAVTSLGHANADLNEVLQNQSELIWHSSNLFYNPQQVLLARALIDITYPGKVFFCNSGTEANEAAIKIMRAWGVQNSTASKNKSIILSLKNSFHGRTFGAMSITGQDKIHNGFGDLMQDVTYIEVNNIKELEKSFNENVCGIILEPVLGEGGVIPLTREFIQKARQLSNEYKAIMVMDEIQTGVGRTGSYFAYQNYGIVPDIVTVAKGLAGGFPIGAVIVGQKYCNVLQSGMHGSTFGGNHLATAVGYEVLRTIESSKILANVTEMSNYFFEKLNILKETYPDRIEKVQGMGLLIGVVLSNNRPARPLVQKALEKQLIIGRAGENVIRLAPPLIVRKATIDKALQKIEEIIREI